MIKCLKSMLTAAALLCVSAQANAEILFAGYAGGNYNDGVMFDVQTSGFLTLGSIDINADLGTFDYQIFYRAGGLTGFESDASAWTLLGNFAALTTNGSGVATTLDIADLALNTGLHGFYITDGGAFSVNYSNSLQASGAVQASSANAQLLVGYGVGGSFDGTTADREFNGALNFAQAVPEPSTWAFLIAGFGMIGVATRRRRAGVSGVQAAA